MEEDRISDLPVEVLQSIIFLLNTESLAQTRLLSTTWRDLQTTEHDHGNIIITATKLVGSNYPYNLKFRSIRFGNLFTATLGPLNRKLHLDFSRGGLRDLYVWKNCLSLMLKCLPSPFVIPISFVRLTELGNLYYDIVTSLLSDIQDLESIEIRKSEVLSDVSVYGNLQLKHVSIIDCLQVESIHVFSGTLKALHYRGKCPTVFIIAPSCSFTDVMLYFRDGPMAMSKNSPIRYLLWETSYIERAKNLTICQGAFEGLIRPTLSSFHGFRHVKELWWIDRCMEEENINSLVTFLKVCPTVKNLFVTIDPTCSSFTNEYINESNSKVSQDGRLNHLDMVKLDGFKNEEDEMVLADHILKMADDTVIVVTSRNSCTRRLVKAKDDPNRLEFVEETDTDMLNSQHIHMKIYGD